jgi:metal-sulfur cluster biosynthetic enzyme
MFNLFGKKKKPIPEHLRRPPPEQPKPEPKPTITVKTPDELESIKENGKIIEVMKNVKDPEIDLDIWTLGLIYDIKLKGKKADIIMTFTTPACPAGDQILKEIDKGLRKIGITPKLDVVFEPFWEPSEEIRAMLGV